MRTYEVEIYDIGKLVHFTMVDAIASEEAKDMVWGEFDPMQTIDIFDTAYTTNCKQVNA